MIGVDISDVSLEIARNKAAAGNVANVQFIEADVTRVGDLEVVKEVVESGGFDTITCAAAAVLIEDLATAVKHWAGLLKTNGRIIFDTPSAFSFIQGMLLEKVGKEIGIPVPFSRTSMASLDEVKKLLSDAELDASKSFVLRDYAEKEEWIETAEGKAVEEWEKMVSEKKFFQRNYLDRVAAEGLTEKAKRVFVKELGRLGGSEGRVKQESRFNVGVGKKQ